MPYDNNNTGTLFNKSAEKKEEHHADYGGDATIDGTDYFIDAYVREIKKDGPNKGKKFFSLRFKKKTKQGGKQEEAPPKEDDSVPF